MIQHRRGVQVACLKEIAHLQGWICADQAGRCKRFNETAYGRAILNTVDGR